MNVHDYTINGESKSISCLNLKKFKALDIEINVESRRKINPLGALMNIASAFKMAARHCYPKRTVFTFNMIKIRVLPEGSHRRLAKSDEKISARRQHSCFLTHY